MTRIIIGLVVAMVLLTGAFVWRESVWRGRVETGAHERRALVGLVEQYRARAARVDTVWRDSVAVVERWRERWRTVEVTDTAAVRAALQECSLAIDVLTRTCEQRVRERDESLRNLQARIDTLSQTPKMPEIPSRSTTIPSHRFLAGGYGTRGGVLTGGLYTRVLGPVYGRTEVRWSWGKREWEGAGLLEVRF